MRPEHSTITLDAPRADWGLGQAVADALGLTFAEIPSRAGTRSRVEGDKRAEDIEPRRYSLAASVDHTEVGHVGVDDTRVFQQGADVPQARR